MFMRYSEEYGGTSAAAHTLMASELARQGLPPNRNFFDGSATPQSFRKLREHHTNATNRAPLAEAFGIARQHNDLEVAARQSRHPSPVPAPGTPTRTSVRDQVQAQKQRLQHQSSEINARSQIASDPGRSTPIGQVTADPVLKAVRARRQSHPGGRQGSHQGPDISQVVAADLIRRCPGHRHLAARVQS